MRFFVDKIASLKCGWNQRALTEEDFFRLCRRAKITVEEMPLSVGGFYYKVAGRHFIAINSRLSGAERTFVMFHEYGHYLLHAPDHGVTANFHGVGHKSRKETEADWFAACALIPRRMIEDPDSTLELADLPEDIVRVRLHLFRSRGI